MTSTERYRRVAEIMDDAYRNYEQGLVALRKRVVQDMKRKLVEGGVFDHPREDSKARSGLRSPK